MPTGYTAAIKDGITFEEYALSCARAFGALVMMRDEPKDATIPDKQEPSTYHIDKVNEAKAKLAIYANYKKDDWQKQQDTEHKTALENYEKAKAEELDLLEKYEAMLSKAQAYVAPSPEHIEFKNFMVNQVQSSIDFDCNYYAKDKNSPIKLPLDDYIMACVKQIEKDITYHSAEYKKELERVDGRNKWIDDLRKSLLF